MELYLNAQKDFSIQDETGKKHTLAEAKQIVLDGKMDDCNMSFQRLINNDFDIEAVKKDYAELAALGKQGN